MKILISAAETSSDAHGAELLRALRAQLPEAEGISAFGVGGPKLQAEGLHAVVDARELLAMGFLEIISRLPRIFGALSKLSQAASEEKPDLAVVIDYPDFHFRLAKRLRRLNVPIIYYIPPKIWIWRKSRIKILKRLFTRILCILPFEEEFYRRENLAVKYVGNPLLDELPMDLTKKRARETLGVGPNDKILVLMPGSRPAELKKHVNLMLEAAVAASKKLRNKKFLKADERLTVLLPFSVTTSLDEVRTRLNTRPGIAVRVS